MHDIVIRGGTVIDGTGEPAFAGGRRDHGGRIAASAANRAGPARDRRQGAAGHAGLGRCAHPLRRAGDVGPAAGAFVLARRHDDDVRQLRRRLRAGEEGSPRALMDMMEGVEEIPDPALPAGLTWEWESFPEFMDALSPRARDRHRGASRAPAAARLRDGRPRHPARAGDADDIAKMRRLTVEALNVGAFGFTTSRTDSHKTPDGELVPSRDADDVELLGIGPALGVTGAGASGMNSDFEDEEDELRWMRKLPGDRPPGLVSVDRPHEDPDAGAA